MEPLLSEQSPECSIPDSESLTSGRLDRLSWWILSLSLFLGSAIAWVHRYTMNPDALSYLEAGEAWLRGEFRSAINGYWNPLYSILTAISAKLSGSRLYEPVGSHLLTIVLYLFAGYAFLRLLQVLQARGRTRGLNLSEVRSILSPVTSALFLWTTVYLIDPAFSMPDLLILAWVLLAAAAWLSWSEQGRKGAVLFGLYLGLGYLTKPVMFPLGLVFLVCSLLPTSLAWPEIKSVRHSALAAIVFFAVCGLYMVPLSLLKGRLTFSDSGGLAYAWEVNRISPYFHWQGTEKGSGIPRHPTREILNFPPTYEFDGPVSGTYPPWRDPGYWNEGLQGHFNARDQLSRLKISARVYFDLFVREPVVPILIFCLAVGFAILGSRASAFATMPFAGLIVPCCASFALYALVFVVGRYLAPFALLGGILLSAACVFGGVTGRSSLMASRVFALLTVLFVLSFSLKSVARETMHPNARSYRVHRLVADELREQGIVPGDKIAVIGSGCEAYYARLAGAQIVAETLIFPGHTEWAATTENLVRIAQAVSSKTAAKALVSSAEAESDDPGWIHVAGTPYRILLLNR